MHPLLHKGSFFYRTVTLIAGLSLVLGVLLPATAKAQGISAVNDSSNIGLPENGVFTGSDFDTIQTNNGYLHIRVPLIDLKGRGLSFPKEFIYDSSSFYETVKTVIVGTHVNNYYTWHLATGVTQNGNPPWKLANATNYVVWTHQNNTAISCSTHNDFTAFTGTIMIEPDGTTHHFVPDNGANGGPCFSPIQNGLVYADDGSGWALRVDPNTANPVYNGNNFDIIRKDGTEIINNGVHTTITDRNGNQISYDNTVGATTDTLGRSTPDHCDSSGVNCEIDYTDSNGQPQKILYTQSSYGYTVPASGCSGLFCTPATGAWNLINQITLPNGLQYNFSYSTSSIGFPVLTSATLPTGATIAWTYSSNSPYSQVVASRTVTANGQNAVWKYAYGTTTIGSVIYPTTTVTDPALNDTRYTCQTILPTQAGVSTVVCQTVKVESFSGSVTTGTLLKTVATDYDTSIFVLPIRETTTWAQTNQVSKVETDWDSYNTGQSVVSWKNPIHRREYAFGIGGPGALVRTTSYNYEHLINSSYRNANLAEFPSSEIVYEANGTTIHSQTLYTYDSTTISSTSNVVHHDYTNFSSTKTVRGNPTLVQHWLNPGNTFLNTTNFYNDLGNLIQTQDPKLNNTYHDYTDSWTNSVCAPASGSTQAFVTKTTNALSQPVKYQYASCTSALTSSSDLNNLVTTMQYDAMGRLTQKNTPDGGQTGVSYGTTLPLINVTTTKIDTSQNLITSVVLDDLGQAKQTQFNSDPQGIVYADTTYDAKQRVATVSNPYRSGTDITTTTGTTTYAYEPLDRKKSESYPDTSVLSTAYCGSTTLVTDPTGRWRRSTTDALGRLVEVDEPNALGVTVNPNGCPGTGEQKWVTSYTYDVVGNLTQVVQNGSHQRNFTYDSLSRLLTSANPETGTITYTYDADGNVQTKKDARLITVTYAYDAINRETSRTYSNGDPTVTTHYDESTCLSPLPQCTNIGQRTSMTDAAGSEIWAYDVPDRMHGEQRTTGGISKSTNYTLNYAGKVISVVYPTTRTVNYTYDAANRFKTSVDGSNGITYATGLKTSPGSTCITGVTCYTPQGTFYALSIGQTSTFTGLNLTHSYNNRLQPNEFKASSTGGFAMDISYNFVDPGSTKNSGHVYGITNNLDTTRSQTFTYDQLNRIISALSTSTHSTSPTHCWSEAYQYDNISAGGAWGNLTQIAATTNSAYTGCTQESGFSATADGNNHLSGLNPDASGNTLTDGTNAYTWDGESQLKSAASVNYLYDGDGRRVSKSNGKLYWYGSGGEILAETNTSGATTAEYIFFGGKRVAMLPASANPIYYVEDLLGTSRVNTTNIGAVCYDADFYPFGGERTPYTNTCTQNYKFEGKERDAETGNDEFGARYYSNRFGRWLSSDWSAVPVAVPYANLANPQTLNLYSMMTDDPESFADLDGHGGDDGESVTDHVLNFVVTAGVTWLSDNLFGLGRPNPQSVEEKVGQSVGDFAAQQTGIGEVEAAATQTPGALVLAGGGQVEALAVPAGLALHGTLTAGIATTHLAKSAFEPGSRPGKDFTPAGKREIDARDGNKCQDCGRDVKSHQNKPGQPTPPDQRQRHHKIHKSQRGSGTPENGETLCPACHKEKHKEPGDNTGAIQQTPPKL